MLSSLALTKVYKHLNNLASTGITSGCYTSHVMIFLTKLTAAIRTPTVDLVDLPCLY